MHGTPTSTCETPCSYIYCVCISDPAYCLLLIFAVRVFLHYKHVCACIYVCEFVSVCLQHLRMCVPPVCTSVCANCIQPPPPPHAITTTTCTTTTTIHNHHHHTQPPLLPHPPTTTIHNHHQPPSYTTITTTYNHHHRAQPPPPHSYNHHHHTQPPPPPHSASNSRMTTCGSRVNVLVGRRKIPSAQVTIGPPHVTVE